MKSASKVIAIIASDLEPGDAYWLMGAAISIERLYDALVEASRRK